MTATTPALPPIPRVHRHKAAYHPRHLVLNHVRKHISRAKRDVAGAEHETDTDPPALEHGQEQLYSFYAPGLEAGIHDITVTQNIASPAVEGVPADEKNVVSTKTFRVSPPRFALPDGEIHSTYPPQGHGDESRILPHVVLTDPHLPWERLGDVTEEGSVSPDEFARNRTPWLALLSFSEDATGQNELHLRPDELNGSNSIFPPSMLQPGSPPIVQSSTYSVYMTLQDLWKMSASVTTPISPNQTGDPVDGSTNANMIFLPTSLFTAFVTKYNDDGTPVSLQSQPDVSRYKYLSHVRHINTTGMTEAGVQEDGLFSVVLGHRSGPISITKPTTVVVHLVSIENVVGNSPGNGILLDQIKTPYVALASLYSWSYQCLPPASLSVADAFTDVGKSASMLHGPLPAAAMGAAHGQKAVPDGVLQRIKDGYSLVRYRTQSGDGTVALNRGALTPTQVPYPSSDTIGGWKMFSNFGTDLQILDKQLGIMDITYSTAWQLGKALAIADRGFASALTRLRNAIHAGAVEATKREVLAHRYRSEESVIEHLSQTKAGLEDIFQGHKRTDMLSRWKRTPEARINLSYRQNDETSSTYLKHGLATARKLASTTDGRPTHAIPDESFHALQDVSSPPELYNEFNTPYSNDWKIVLNWVLDKMYLSNLPAHYLITDPSSLPNESLRFFHIDRNWIDCFLDGALSLANQVSRDDDQVRGIIKSILEVYITGELSPFFGYAPQIPTFGFLMRSSLVTRFPDLVVTAPRAPGDLRVPILRQENVAKDTLLVLLDRLPSDPDFKSLLISQPQHQQFFSLGATLGPDPTAPAGIPNPILELELMYTRVYAPTAKIDPHVKDEYASHTVKSSDAPSVFDWKNRTLIFPAFAQNVYDQISSGMNKLPNLPPNEVANFSDTAGGKGLPSSALLGIQMNEPMYQMEVHIPSQVEATANTGQTKRMDVTKSTEVAALPKEAPQTASSSRPYEPATSQPLQQQYPLPTPEERKRIPPNNPKHSAIPGPPPHQRPRRIPMFLDPNRTPKFTLDPPGTDKNFAITCHHISHFGKPVPTNIAAPMDLIFSIQLRPGYRTNWQLKRLHFEIPMEKKPSAAAAAASGNNNSPPLLRANYQDATVAMLSNQRFNAWGPVAAPDNSALNVVLQPRWAPKPAALDVKQEWSFVLNQVRVVQGFTGQVRVNVNQDFAAVSGPQPEQVRGWIMVDLAPVAS